MLQHAQTTPAFTTPAGNTPVAATATNGIHHAPATYGNLIAAAQAALDDAIAISNVRQPSVADAHLELLGYERFLYTAGNHMTLLMNLADLHTDALRTVTNRLQRATSPGTAQGSWFRAATVIGAAHDLLASHLIDGVPRTLDAKQRLIGPNAAIACRGLTEMILDAVDGSQKLMHRTARAQQRREPHRIPAKTFARIRTTNKLISLCARATMWDLIQVPQHTSETLTTLEIALPSDLTRAAAVPANNAFAALRVLSQLCHDQALGVTSASPASLRDLALLGKRINSPELLGPAKDDRPLTRLQRAHAADQIDAAHAAWTAASTELTTAVRGISKAPGPYGTAIQSLLTQPLSPRTRHALATALPTLGRDAARTVETLALRGDLVTLQPIPLQPRNAWRAITSEHSDAIAARFRNAADASSRSASAIHDLERHRDEPQRAPAPRQRALQVEQARGVAR